MGQLNRVAAVLAQPPLQFGQVFLVEHADARIDGGAVLAGEQAQLQVEVGMRQPARDVDVLGQAQIG